MLTLDNVDFFCISLNNDYGKEKWNRTYNDFKNHGIEIKCFNAIDGSKLVVPEICPYSNTKVVLNNGEYGCFLSHIEVIKIAKEHNLDYVFIFEDDVMLSDDFKNRIEYLISCEIDFDMFYLGGSFNSKTLNYTKTKNKYIYNYVGSAGGHGYIVNKRIYEYIINNIRFDRALDGFYSTVIGNEYDDRIKNKIQFDIKGFIPHCVGCYPNYSVLQNIFTENNEMNSCFLKTKLDL